MQQDAQEQEDEVDDVQVQGSGHALAGRQSGEVVDDIGKAGDYQNDPQDLGVLHLVGGRLGLAVVLLFLIDQQSGIDGNGMILVRMHGIVDEGHGQQDYAAHDQVHGVENGIGSGGGQHHLLLGAGEDLIALGQLQGDGAGQTGVPDDEAGVGGGDQQGIVHSGDALGHFTGQQSAGDQAEAPVQPAAHSGDHGGDHDSLHVVVAQAGGEPQRLLAGPGGCHGTAQHQHQRHLHGEGQQIPEAAGGTPGIQNLQRAHLGGDHRKDIDDDGQNDREQEGIGQPSVDHAHAAVGKFLEHEFHSPHKMILQADVSGRLLRKERPAAEKGDAASLRCGSGTTPHYNVKAGKIKPINSQKIHERIVQIVK